jgi:hypothetical protein
MTTKFPFTFKPVETVDRILVHSWLVQPHYDAAKHKKLGKP